MRTKGARGRPRQHSSSFSEYYLPPQRSFSAPAVFEYLDDLVQINHNFVIVWSTLIGSLMSAMAEETPGVETFNTPSPLDEWWEEQQLKVDYGKYARESRPKRADQSTMPVETTTALLRPDVAGWRAAEEASSSDPSTRGIIDDDLEEGEKVAIQGWLKEQGSKPEHGHTLQRIDATSFLIGYGDKSNPDNSFLLRLSSKS